MTRHFFWVAAALALSLPQLTSHNRAIAQETGAAAEADADTTDATADTDAASNDQADAQADTQADAEIQASDDSSTQADAETNTSDDPAHADAHVDTSDEAAQDPAPPASNETQDAATDTQNTQTGDTRANNNQPANQSRQGTSPALPPPTSTDANANPQREQSRLTDGQQRDRQGQQGDRQRAGANRDQSDFSAQGRANRGERSGRDRDRQNDFRAGIQFGRATDRGLAINHIDQNSFYYRNGFRRGDVVVSVHGRPVRNDADFMRFFVLEQGQRVPIVVLRDGRRETIYVEYRDVAQNQRGFENQQYRTGDQQYRSGGAYLGVSFDAQVRDAAVVLNVTPGSPAQEAGLQAGDILLALNGQEVRSYQDAIAMVRAMQPGDELEIIVERARGERQIVAMLDAAPTVRTAGRPDVQYEQQTTIEQQPNRFQLEAQGEYDDDDGRLLNRNRNSDDNRGRGILPRLRN
jgi:C-terminal processing protease CtpA/Prc